MIAPIQPPEDGGDRQGGLPELKANAIDVAVGAPSLIVGAVVLLASGEQLKCCRMTRAVGGFINLVDVSTTVFGVAYAAFEMVSVRESDIRAVAIIEAPQAREFIEAAAGK